MWIVIIIVVILLGVAGVLVYIGIRHPAPDDDAILQQRLDEFVEKGENVSLESLELAQPFRDRVIYPVARKLGELAIKFTPQNALNSIHRKLDLAGNPTGIDPTIFLAMQMVFGALLSGTFFFVFTFGQTKISILLRLVLVVVFFLLGYYLPSLWLGGKISKRQGDVRKQMPDALDLLIMPWQKWLISGKMRFPKVLRASCRRCNWVRAAGKPYAIWRIALISQR
jgi:tight adherence protein C